MCCSINSGSQSKRVFLPNHSIFSTAGYRRIKDAKNGLRAEKMIFFGFLSSVAHLHIETHLFCFYQNFISSAVQRNHGGTRKKALHQRRTTNDERRTTWTIIIPRQDSQNPRANKKKFIDNFFTYIIYHLS